MVSRNLKAAKVYRGGQTARALSLETRAVTVRRDKAAVQMQFSMDSKGGGVTNVLLTIGAEDFEALLATMVSADRQQAMNAMAAELAKQVAQQPEHDAKTATDAREAVRQLAHDKFVAAPLGNNDTERFVETQVKKLVVEIEAPEAAKRQAAKGKAA